MLSRLPHPAVNRIVVTSYGTNYTKGASREMAKKDFSKRGHFHVKKINWEDIQCLRLK